LLNVNLRCSSERPTHCSSASSSRWWRSTTSQSRLTPTMAPQAQMIMIPVHGLPGPTVSTSLRPWPKIYSLAGESSGVRRVLAIATVPRWWSPLGAVRSSAPSQGRAGRWSCAPISGRHGAGRVQHPAWATTRPSQTPRRNGRQQFKLPTLWLARRQRARRAS
jgi:hypothetical protein